jgi:membrane protease YdiL (CAAX protease family)
LARTLDDEARSANVHPFAGKIAPEGGGTTLRQIEAPHLGEDVTNSGTPYEQPGHPPAPLPPRPKRFGVGAAFLCFGVYLGAQFIVGLFAGIVIGVATATGGAAPDWLMPTAMLASFVLGGAALYATVRQLLGGPVWKRGGGKFGLVRTALGPTVVAAFGGAGLATLYVVVAVFVLPPEGEPQGVLAEMAGSSGYGFAIWLCLALALAPFLEEFLFRGVMFHGLSRGIGPWWATILVTVLFIALHLVEAAQYWPALVFVASLAVFALVVRVRYASLAPAVVAHFSYNAVIAIVAAA